MKPFTEFINEEHIELIEKLITVGGKAYPNFGNVVILAGGAGSGKGFVKDKLLGIEGKVFDVDFLKKLSLKAPILGKRIKKDLGIDLSTLSLRNSEDVSKLHDVVGDYLALPDKKQRTVAASILMSHPERKPNLIFDVTLKDLRKLEKITRMAQKLGYPKKQVHIVWVINDVEVAKKQNLDTSRGRVVPVEILINTHRGAQQTMADVLNMGNSLKKYMDGDIVFAFNKVGVDSTLQKGSGGGVTIKDANYFYVKRAGEAVTPVDKLSKDIRKKVSSYVPSSVSWD